MFFIKLAIDCLMLILVVTLYFLSADVLDLAWSPDKSYLASCSIDNTIIIWNALKFPGQCTSFKL